MQNRAGDPFDRHALDYRRAWDDDPVARGHRRRVHELLAGQLRAGARILDLGCGTGTDAAELARRGFAVAAVDRSRGMLARAEEQCRGLAVSLSRVDLERPETLPAGPFDGVLADFGVLNCVDPRPVAAALADRVVEGGAWVAVVMPRWSPMEIAAFTLAGHPREAWRRRAGTTAKVDGSDVPVRWIGAGDLARAAAPWFELVDRRALGVVTPPPGRSGGLGPLALAALDGLDRIVGRAPILRAMGDHVAAVLRRGAAAP